MDPESSRGPQKVAQGVQKVPKGFQKVAKRHEKDIQKGFHKASKCTKQVHWEFSRQFDKQCYCQCNRHCNSLPQPPTQRENKYPNRLVQSICLRPSRHRAWGTWMAGCLGGFVALLLCCLIAWLLGCFVALLLCCVVALLLGCFVACASHLDALWEPCG